MNKVKKNSMKQPFLGISTNINDKRVPYDRGLGGGGGTLLLEYKKFMIFQSKKFVKL
jgi:hypothetical protein